MNTRPYFILFIVFIIYGTQFPFSYCEPQLCFNENIAKVSWNPFVKLDGTRPSIPDIVQNILLFIPLGFFGILSLKKRNFWSLLTISLFGFCLSATAEFLQLFTDNRTTSATDVATNSLGTIIGAVSAQSIIVLCDKILGSENFKFLRDDNLAFLVGLCALFIAIGGLHPFDVTLDVGYVWSNVKYIFWGDKQFDPLLKDELVVALRFVLFSGLLCYWFSALKLVKPHFFSFIASSIFGIGLELGQVFIISRLPTHQDFLLVIMASYLGSWMVNRKLKQENLQLTANNPLSRQWVWLLITASIFSVLIFSIHPFEFAHTPKSMNWIPFMTYYERTSFVALSNFFESALLYVPLGFLIQYISQSERIVYFRLFSLLPIIFLIEATQIWVEGRYPEITDVIGASLGILLAAHTATIYRKRFSKKPLN